MADFWQWKGNPETGAGYISKKTNTGLDAVYSGVATFSSGSTATSSNTFSVGALTAAETTLTHEMVITNDGPYDITADVYKTVSAGASANADVGINFLVPATKSTAGVTVSAKGVQLAGLFNFNQGLTVRLTLTAAVTALVTNNIIIKELDV